MSKLRTLASFNWLALVLAVALLAAVIFGYCKWRQASYHLVPFPKADFLALDLARGGLDPTQVFNADGSMKLGEQAFQPPYQRDHLPAVKMFYGDNFYVRVDEGNRVVYAEIDPLWHRREEMEYSELDPLVTAPSAGSDITILELQRNQIVAAYGPPSIRVPECYIYCFDLGNEKSLDIWFPFGMVREWEDAHEDDPVHGLILHVGNSEMAKGIRSRWWKRSDRVYGGPIYQWPFKAEPADEP